jgi:hypothetical protein
MNPSLPPKKSTPDQLLQFKPLSKGLGFHLFSHGLPYAVSLENKPSLTENKPSLTSPMGTGAIAAGPPQFAYPPMTQRPSSVSRKPATRSEILTLTSLSTDNTYLLRRIIAAGIDLLFNAIFFVLALISSMAWQQVRFDLLLSAGSLNFLCILFSIGHWGGVTAQEMLFKTSFGKKIVGLRLDGSSIQILGRALLWIPSTFFFGFGIISSIFDPEKRCWHDKWCELQPTEPKLCP